MVKPYDTATSTLVFVCQEVLTLLAGRPTTAQIREARELLRAVVRVTNRLKGDS